MKIINQQTNLYDKQQNVRFKKQSTFKGVCGFLRFLSDEPVWGAAMVDVGSMVVPRTATDIKKRGFNAGFETGFRESSSSLNDALIGMYGVIAGTLIARTINRKYDISAKKIFAADDIADIYTKKWIKHNGNVNNYVDDVVNNLRAYNPKSTKADAKGFIEIPKEHKKAISEDLKYLIDGEKSQIHERWNIVKEKLNTRLLDATGVEKNYKLMHNEAGVEKSVVSESRTLMEDFYRFTDALKSNKAIGKSKELLKDYKGFAKSRTLLGLLVGGGLAVSFQPINVYMSKKRTGTDGFVGVDGRKKDNSLGFKILKSICAAGMMLLSLGSMGALSKNVKEIPKLFLQKNQYKGKNPTINHFKTIYGLTITSRLLMARDKDELREITIKDTLGYLNWLILGNVVTQCILHKFNPNLLKKDQSCFDGSSNLYKKLGKRGKKIYEVLTSSVVSHREIVAEGLKKECPNVKLIKPNGNAMTFKEMLKALPKGGKTMKNLRLRNIAQVSGYVYSALVLGLAVPNLNIWLTNRIDNKRKEKLSMTNILNNKKQKQPIDITKNQDKTVFGQFHHNNKA